MFIMKLPQVTAAVLLLVFWMFEWLKQVLVTNKSQETVMIIGSVWQLSDDSTDSQVILPIVRCFYWLSGDLNDSQTTLSVFFNKSSCDSNDTRVTIRTLGWLQWFSDDSSDSQVLDSCPCLIMKVRSWTSDHVLVPSLKLAESPLIWDTEKEVLVLWVC